MLAAYEALAAAGHAHSVETWVGGQLVGGLYGVAAGRMFYGESMFSRTPDASKVALAALVRQLRRWGFELIDCQMTTTHLASLGAREIPRTEFMRHVTRLTRLPVVPSPWTIEPDVVETV
jgi:leucyl/phenylalanyl-tRNA--protein transferase